MKHILVLFFMVAAGLLCALELDLSSARLRGCAKSSVWFPPEAKAVRPGRSADLYFAFDKTRDFSRYNRIRVELTPVAGKFVKRNQILSFFSGSKEICRFRPQNASGSALLENGKKAVLDYIIASDLRSIDAMRLFFNRLPDDRSDQIFRLHKVEFYHQFAPRSHTQFRYKLNTPTCVLLADNDRGLTPEEARFDDHGKRQQLRPVPIAKLPAADRVSGRGRAEKESVSVELLNESSCARNTFARFGVPFASGEVYSLQNILLTDEAGKPVPVQLSALSRYPDRSLRHLFVTAQVSLKANEKKQYRLFYGNRVTAVPVKNKITYSCKDGVLQVDAGRLKAVVRQKGFCFAQKLTVDGKDAGKFLPATIVTADEKAFTLADPERFEIIESGPLRLTLRAAGRYTGNAGSYVCRITFIYNKAQIDVEFTHINSVLDMEFTDFRSLALGFAPAGKVKEEIRIFQETDLEYSRNGGKRQPGRLSGAFRFTDRFGIAVADWWQRYPKAVTARKDGIAIELLPLQPDRKFNTDLPPKLSYLYSNGNYRMKWGMSFTERITFAFDGSPAELLAAERNLPVFGVLPFVYYRKAGFVPDDSNLQPVNALASDALNRYLKRQEREREYGFFNYGDSFGERGHSWTNNEYDPVHGVLETYLRTGERAMLRYGIASARHQADVDTCHAYPDDYFIGANLQHAVGHSGVGRRWSSKFNRYTAAGNGHSWVRGRIMVWLLTGDTTVMDSAYMFGDHAAFAAIPNYKTILGKAPRETGWMLRGLSALYAVTADPFYFKAAKTMADLAVRECAYENGAWPRPIRRLSGSYGVDTMGNNNFQVAVMIRGLCDYYRINPDPQVKKAIISSARWLAKGFNPGNSAGFNYDIDIKGNGLNWPVSQLNYLIAPPLAEAAVLADDPALFAVAKRAFAMVMLGIPADDHKHFALVWTFLADYLRAEAQWNKKYQLSSDYSREAQLKIFFDGVVAEWRIRGNSKWEIISLADNAQICIRRWIRSGLPRQKPVFTIRSADGKVVCRREVRPDILRQDFKLTLPCKKGSRFTFEVTDSFSGDWMMDGSSQSCYAVVMTPEGIPVAHNGLHRFFFEIPAGKTAEVAYAGSHLGFWSIHLNDQGKIFSQTGCAEKVQLHKLRDNAALFRLPAAKKSRIVYMDCFSATDARILVRGAGVLSADRRYFNAPGK